MVDLCRRRKIIQHPKRGRLQRVQINFGVLRQFMGNIILYVYHKITQEVERQGLHAHPKFFRRTQRVTWELAGGCFSLISTLQSICNGIFSGSRKNSFHLTRCRQIFETLPLKKSRIFGSVTTISSPQLLITFFTA